jgi:DNA-binding SARP family transcriptional activator
VEIRLLGPLEVSHGGNVLALPRRQQRALLAALALRAGEVVATDRLVADLWGESAPASATGSLQNTVWALRKLLGRDVLVTQAPGYRLAVGADSVDANRFERLLESARKAEPAARAELLREALALWRGPALADLDEEHFARLEAARLDELRVTALEERVDTELELGRHAALVGELETLVATHPLRERLRGQLMLALYRCGRQAEALEVYRAARLALADELGLDPSPDLQELERRVLRQDPSLAPPVTPSADVAPVRAERRLVSVLVAVPPAEDDPEALRQQLDELLGAARDTLARHGGELERFGPEGLVAVFGAEAPRDDDAIRAAAAADELGLRAGVATGEMVAGAGAVFVRAAELARGPGVQLDGRTHALVHAVRRLDAPLVGRREELAQLEAELAATREEGRCRVVTVLGEAGIGKTRLARELVLNTGAEVELLVARCLSYGEGATFLPLLSALRRVEPSAVLAGESDGALVIERLAALAGGADAVSLGESYWAVRRLIEVLAASRPVLLVLDDVHWAEPALLDLVDYLAERAAVPALVLCLARPELERALGETVRLGPLDDEHARLVVQSAAQLDEQTQERIVGLAEGNALYVEQLAAYAAESGEGLPPTLEAVLAGRLGQLDADERAVLQRAAVVGKEFTRGAVAALVEGVPFDAQLASLGRRGLIRAARDAEPGDDAYRFHHVLLRDAAYATLTKRDRADLHERTAAWLDRDGPGDDALVGYHLEQAADLLRSLGDPADKLSAAAGDRLALTAMRAWRQNDARAAVGLLRRATALLPAGAQRAELLCELALAQLNAGEGDGRDTLARAADDARRAGSRRISARIAVERSALDFRDGETSATELLETALGATEVLAAADDYRGLGRAWVTASIVHEWACRYADAADAARMAREGYERASFSPAAITSVLAFSVLYGPSHVQDAISQCCELREASSDRLTSAHATMTLGALAALEERFDEAGLLCQEARELYESIGSERVVNWTWSTSAMLVERRAGKLDAAATIARNARHYFARRGERPYESTWAARLAELLYWSAEHDGAARAVAAARQGAVDHDVYVQFLWRSTAAKLAAREGLAEKAERLSEEALQLAAASDSPLLLADLWIARAEVFQLGGRAGEAADAADRARALLREKGDSAGLAEIERLLSPPPDEEPHRALRLAESRHGSYPPPPSPPAGQ